MLKLPNIAILGLCFISSSAAGQSPLDVIRPVAATTYRYHTEPINEPVDEVPDDFPDLKLNATAEAVEIVYPHQPAFETGGPIVDVLLADSNARCELPDGNGTVSIAAMATYFHDGKGKQDLTAHWIHPTTHAPVANAPPDVFPAHSPKWGTQLKLILQADGVANPLWMNYSVYDAQTRKPLDLHADIHDRDNPSIYQCRGPMWHDGPVTVVLDLAYGVFQEAQAPARAGSILRPEGALVQLYHIQRGYNSGKFNRGDPNRLALKPDPQSEHTVVVVGFTPANWGWITDLELIDRHGHVSRTTASNNETWISAKGFRDILADDVVEFRVKKRPFRSRIIVELPGLPGMPNRRTEIADGLDLQIPFVKFGKLREMLDFIRDAAHLNSYPDLSKQPGIASLTFPRTYRDASVREMLSDIETAIGSKLRIEQERFRLELAR